MADYKRMVSYMYLYENGVKKKNVGFARVEARNGECKFTLHMQLLGLLDSIFPTYLIQRQGKEMELIYLGDSVLKNQVMDSKMSANERNIKDSGYQLSQMGGLLLFLNEEVFFATEWDDKPILLDEVMEALKPKKQSENQEADNVTDHLTDKDDSDNALEEEIEAVNPDAVQNTEEKAIDIDAEIMEQLNSVLYQEKEEQITAARLTETEIPLYKLPRGWKIKEMQQKPMENRQEINPWRTVQRMQKLQEEKVQEAQQVEADHINSNEAEPEEVTIPLEPLMDQSEEIHAEAAQHFSEKFYNEECDREKVREDVKYGKEESESPDHPQASRILENYPRIYPFEDNEITMCVKIEPKDIGTLPVDAWALSNNSFLLHGYYCYHHLIFAKMKDRYGCRYILGVPGIFHNRERFMARMFGFECFKSIRKRELRQGDFGYWYIPISM